MSAKFPRGGGGAEQPIFSHPSITKRHVILLVKTYAKQIIKKNTRE